MAEAVENAIFEILEGDATLVGMLAVDPHPNAAGRPAIFGSYVTENARGALPQLIVAELSDDPDPDMQLSGYVFHNRFHIEARAKTEGAVHKALIARVDALLHEKRLILATGNHKYTVKDGGMTEDFDEAAKESFSIGIYRIVYNKPA